MVGRRGEGGRRAERHDDDLATGRREVVEAGSGGSGWVLGYLRWKKMEGRRKVEKKGKKR
jgi:hypothetical protein